MEVVEKAITNNEGELKELSEAIWREPELNYEEHTAHRLLTDYLEKKGFEVERGYCGIPTAFRARYGRGYPNICVICEYDALPGIGHACGHNLIAEAGVATGLGVKAYLESQQGKVTGTVTVMGTPAEEGGGGKVIMIEKGAFNGIDIAIMAHPSPSEAVVCGANTRMVLDIEYKGKAAHAAAFPWEGVNALDGAILAYNNISVLRQQMKPTWRVHGVFTNGGAKPNIIPETASLQYYIRAPNMDELAMLKEKVTACFEGAAQATGCTVSVTVPAPTYADIRANMIMSRLYAKHLEAVGTTDYEFERMMSWSTDMGNVSYVVPSIHPVYKIGDQFNHTPEFTSVSNTPEAHKKTLSIARVMAMTCIDILDSKEVLENIKKEFDGK